MGGPQLESRRGPNFFYDSRSILSHSPSLWTSDLLVNEDSVEVMQRGGVMDSFNGRKEKVDLKGLYPSKYWFIRSVCLIKNDNLY